MLLMLLSWQDPLLLAKPATFISDMLLTLASMIEIKSVVLCQLGFRATCDCTNQMALALWQAPTHQTVPVQPSWRQERCGMAVKGVKDSLGKDLAAQQALSIAESKRRVMDNWQFGKERLQNKVVSFALLLGQHKAQSKDCRSCCYPGLICPVMPWGVHILQSRM